MDKIAEKTTKENYKEKARIILTESLKNKNLRKTPERFAILDAIYDFNSYFSIEELREKVKKLYHYHVSISTYYNTLNLFMEFNLVLRCPFNKNTGYFEKAIGNAFIFYKVCNNCGKITTFKNKVLAKELLSMQCSRFTAYNYSICCYGLCSKCARNFKKSLKKELEKKI